MDERVPGFVGNVEGRDVPAGVADVIVTDGFTGNVALKLLEGLSKTLIGGVKETLTENPATHLAALAIRPGLRRLAASLDPDTYGGAPLLGVDGVCIIGHGSSSANAVASALQVAAHEVRGGLVDSIREAVAEE
jgi:glycerol-3-phosphate acyltransferase PlsX